MSNPFFQAYETPFQTAPFHLIKNEHFLPAVEEGIQQGKAEINQIIAQPEAPTFENTIVAMERAGELLEKVTGVFFNLNSAETSDEIQALAREISPLLTEYGNDILLNSDLFERVKIVYDQRAAIGLTPEQMMLLEKTYKSFVRNGALLSEEQKVQLRAIDKEKSQLSLEFGEHVLAESNAFKMVLDDESQLEGLPDYAKVMAKQQAEQDGMADKWVITLDYPSYVPFMTYAANRELREKLYKAFSSKAFHGDENDNQQVLKRIATLRHNRAVLLGYESHAHFVLEERMAGSAKKVNDFLLELLEQSKPFAEKEKEELEDFAASLGAETPLKRWDTGYYSEKLKKQKFDIDDEALKPYFQLEKVIDGVFLVAEKLFGLKFKVNADIPVYHKDVMAYEVEKDGQHLAVFYADFFPRKGKRQGAWMTSFREQFKVDGKDHRPHVSIVCNFTPSTKGTPSLLTFNEVTTLFHEFGHALHGMLANTTYQSLGGTNVYWDFVELPSQLMENWCYEKECLDLFAKHYQTGEPIPTEFIQRIKDSANFHAGLMMLRQLSFGLMDMAWHSQLIDPETNVQAFECKAMAACDLWPAVDESCMSTSFSHIFQGGYSAGYYSYKWAEVLEADAFEAFQEKGVFDRATAQSFLDNVLSKGGTQHPAVLYRNFRGKDPDASALLRRNGMVD